MIYILCVKNYLEGAYCFPEEICASENKSKLENIRDELNKICADCKVEDKDIPFYKMLQESNEFEQAIRSLMPSDSIYNAFVDTVSNVSDIVVTSNSFVIAEIESC